MAIVYHQPKSLPLDGLQLDANRFMQEKSNAEYALGHLQGSGGEGYGKSFFNPKLLLSPLATKEATISSKIEGTISTVSDVYRYEAGETPEYSGTAEVANYRKAITQAIHLVNQGRHIDQSLLRSTHRTLLTGVRHKGILGDFRRDDVWIGEKKNDPIEEAIYVPPKAVSIEPYMSNLLEYLEKGKEDPLTKAAIIHYQFEAVHPFEDGNGRIGRLLIPLILFQKNRISLPILYMSGYFESHRDEYLTALHKVDQTLEYEDWLCFFFRSVSEQLQETQQLMQEINKLYDETKEKFPKFRSPYLLPFLGYLFEHPVFNPTNATEALGATYAPTARLIKLFEGAGIIIQIKPGLDSDRRFKLYSFGRLLDLLMS